MSKILVTGGNGFVGRPLVQKLREQEHTVRTVGRHAIYPKRAYYNMPIVDHHAHYNGLEQHYTIDLSDDVKIRRLFKHWIPDTIIHLAANPNGKPDMVAPTAILDDNIKATQNLLHWCKPGTHFLFASSIVTYGNHGNCRINEHNRQNPTSLYAISKLASEHLIQAYAEYNDIRYKILRLSAIVGPGLTHGILKDFIHKLKNNDKLEMLGDCPGSRKPYTHVEDVVNALCQILDFSYKNDNLIFNFCSEESITVEDIANIVMDNMNMQKEKVWLGAEANWKGDNPKLYVSSNKALEWGLQLNYSSKQAIAKAVKENNND